MENVSKIIKKHNKQVTKTNERSVTPLNESPKQTKDP